MVDIPECLHSVVASSHTMTLSVKRTFIRGESIDESLRSTIIDSIVAEGGDSASVFFPGAFFNCDMVQPPANKFAKGKECDHVRS